MKYTIEKPRYVKRFNHSEHAHTDFLLFALKLFFYVTFYYNQTDFLVILVLFLRWMSALNSTAVKTIKLINIEIDIAC